MPLTSTRGRLARDGQCHEEAAQELARDVSLDEAQSPPESPLASMVTGGQPVPRSDVGRRTAGRCQRDEQVGDRPLPHPRAAVQVESPLAGRQHRRQKAEACPRIRHVKRGRARRNRARSSPEP